MYQEYQARPVRTLLELPRVKVRVFFKHDGNKVSIACARKLPFLNG